MIADNREWKVGDKIKCLNLADMKRMQDCCEEAGIETMMWDLNNHMLRVMNMPGKEDRCRKNQ
jgi:hypothetical protein